MNKTIFFIVDKEYFLIYIMELLIPRYKRPTREIANTHIRLPHHSNISMNGDAGKEIANRVISPLLLSPQNISVQYFLIQRLHQK